MHDPLDDVFVSTPRSGSRRRIPVPALVAGTLDRVRRFWDSIREPRHIKVAYWFIYLSELLGGVWLLLEPPQTVQGELGPLLTVIWAVGFIIGGTVGMCTVLGGWWKVERYGLWFALGSIAMYGSVILFLHFTAAGSRAMGITISVFGASVFIVRALMIRGRDFEPRGQE